MILRTSRVKTRSTRKQEGRLLPEEKPQGRQRRCLARPSPRRLCVPGQIMANSNEVTFNSSYSGRPCTRIWSCFNFTVTAGNMTNLAWNYSLPMFALRPVALLPPLQTPVTCCFRRGLQGPPKHSKWWLLYAQRVHILPIEGLWFQDYTRHGSLEPGCPKGQYMYALGRFLFRGTEAIIMGTLEIQMFLVMQGLNSRSCRYVDSPSKERPRRAYRKPRGFQAWVATWRLYCGGLKEGGAKRGT